MRNARALLLLGRASWGSSTARRGCRELEPRPPTGTALGEYMRYERRPVGARADTLRWRAALIGARPDDVPAGPLTLRRRTLTM